MLLKQFIVKLLLQKTESLSNRQALINLLTSLPFQESRQSIFDFKFINPIYESWYDF